MNEEGTRNKDPHLSRKLVLGFYKKAKCGVCDSKQQVVTFLHTFFQQIGWFNACYRSPKSDLYTTPTNHEEVIGNSPILWASSLEMRDKQ